MITGHVGIAFGARALDKRAAAAHAPLPWLFAASVAPDMLDGVYAVARYCNPSGAYSHSLPAVALLSLLFGAAAYVHTRSGTTAMLVAVLVVLHLPADYVTGHKALWPGGPVWGLFIYRWPWIDFFVELPVIVAGWWMLRRSGYTPRRTVSVLALAMWICVQGFFDVVGKAGPSQGCRQSLPGGEVI